MVSSGRLGVLDWTNLHTLGQGEFPLVAQILRVDLREGSPRRVRLQWFPAVLELGPLRSRPR